MSVSKSESESDDDAPCGVEHVEFVRVHLGGETYVFELGRVHKLVRSPSITRVPQTPPTIAGVTEIQGDVTAVIDGRTLFGADNRGGRGSPRILVVFAEMEHDQTAGVLVDGIEGIVTHPVDAIEPTSADGTGPEEAEVDWFTAVIDGETWVFDPEQLVEAAGSEY